MLGTFPDTDCKHGINLDDDCNACFIEKIGMKTVNKLLALNSKNIDKTIPDTNITIREIIDACCDWRDEIIDKYNELIYGVSQKFPTESRHETALRYIMEREANTDNTPKQDIK